MSRDSTITLPYKQFRITLSLEDERPVSHFLAATLRGGFGSTLRSIVCTTPQQQCPRCLLKHTCAYAYLFETFPAPGSARLNKYRAIPRPFTMVPQQKGDTIEILLTLIGNSIRYLPYFIYTLNTLGRKGLGKRKIRFSVHGVCDRDETVLYPVAENEVAADITPDMLSVYPGEMNEGERILDFYTPLVVRKNGTILEHFDGDAFVRTLLRRVTNLHAFYGEPPLHDIDPSPYLKPVQEISFSSRMHKKEAARFSTRQKKHIDYSGIIGRVHLQGNIGSILPLLQAGEILGVGKNTVFGYGQYRIQEAA